MMPIPEPPFEQLALVVIVGAIAVMAALFGHWDVVGLALTGCLGGLNLSRRPTPPPQT